MRRFKLAIVERGPRDEAAVRATRARRFFQLGLSRRLLVIGLALALVLAVADVFLLQRSHHSGNVDSARAAAMKSASTRVPAMLSYSYATIDTDLAAAKKNTTGNFRKDYAILLSKVVAPNAKQKKITTKAIVTGASVVKGDKDRVVILLFLTQSTQGAKGTTPLVSGSRVNVTMTKTDAGWLVSAITPV